MDFLHLPEKIETERLLIQRLRYEDAEEIFYTYASKTEATRFVSWPTHTGIKATREFLTYARSAWKQGLEYSYTIRLHSNAQLIGSYGVINERGRIQFGYILSPTYWNMGLATEACKKVTSMLTALPGIHRLGTYVDCDNLASIRVLEKCGYQQEAKLSHWMRFPNQENKAKDCWVYVWPRSIVAFNGS